MNESWENIYIHTDNFTQDICLRKYLFQIYFSLKLQISFFPENNAKRAQLMEHDREALQRRLPQQVV